MDIFCCPHCSVRISLKEPSCYKTLALNKNLDKINASRCTPFITIHKIECINCDHTMIRLSLKSADIEHSIPIQPSSDAKKLPDYIPQVIQEDYIEACSILHLSPKASAALARRCIQSMLRDYWKITKWNLTPAIKELQNKIEPELYDAICDVRDLGNIGAHPELNPAIIVDIEPWEAQYTIALIEILIDEWYVKRHNRCAVYDKLHEITQLKEQYRKSQ